MNTPSEADTIQFVKDKLKTALTGLTHTAFDHEHIDDSMKRFMESWLLPKPESYEAYKMAVFDSYGFVHYTPKDGDSRPRYGWQAVLNGPLFESRKDFRSLRLARLWVKSQMKCKCWPMTTTSEPDSVDASVINMTIDFKHEGELDKTRLAKNDSFR